MQQDLMHVDMETMLLAVCVNCECTCMHVPYVYKFLWGSNFRGFLELFICKIPNFIYK